MIILFLLVWLILTILSKKNIERYDNSIKNYILTPIKEFPLVKYDTRLVLSFSTIPKRLQFVPKVLELIKKQSYQPDKIYINIPYYFKRKQEYYNVPSDWKFDDNVVIIRCEDYGPATKLLGCIEHEKDDDTMIITIDDDQDYHENVILKLVTYAMNYPNHCIGRYAHIGPNMIPPMTDNVFISPYIKYLEGYGGVLYRRKYITNDMVSYIRKLNVDSCYKSDDMTISSWLLMNNAILLKFHDDLYTMYIDEIDKFDALHREERNDVYLTCYKELSGLQFLRRYIWIKSYNEMSDHYEKFNLNVITTFDENNYENIRDKDIICIRTRHLYDFITKIFMNINVSIILLTVDDDFIVPNDLWKENYSNSDLKKLKRTIFKDLEINFDISTQISFDDFIKDKRLIHWFCQNLNGEYLCDKLTHLPIGIDYHTDYVKNNQHPYSQEKRLEDIKKVSIPLEHRSILCYGNFQHNNTSRRFKNVYGEDRKDIYDKLKNNTLIHFEQNKTDQYTFWKKINDYSFIISPLGNGLDCHRTWEILILGSIPIVKTSVLDKIYEGLPVVIVNDWNDITLDNLVKWKKWVLNNKNNFIYDKLTTDYWKKEFNKYKLDLNSNE